VWKSAVCSAKPILVSRQDVLTDETAEAIGDHNNVLFCQCPYLRPLGFDPKVCAM